MGVKFTETQLEKAFTTLLERQGYSPTNGKTLVRNMDDVLLEDDLRAFLEIQYRKEGITANEIKSIIQRIKSLPSSDLYESNKTFMHMVSEGFLLKREDRTKKDIYIQLIDFQGAEQQITPPEKHLEVVSGEYVPNNYYTDGNIWRFVTQLEIFGNEKRIPDGIIYINGLPLVVLEFKSSIREEATVHDAYIQLSVRYRRDIPELMKYHAFCIISDGVNSKAGSIFSKYDFFYAWRRIKDNTKEVQGINSMHTMIEGMLHRDRLRDIIRNFIFIPDQSQREEKIICRYPQYYAANLLYDSIKKARKPEGDGKGGTYFGATGCGKSFTMLYLSRLLMRSAFFASPTLVLITDRTDLDDQLARDYFQRARKFIGDDHIVSVESRAHLRAELSGKQSGGVFLTTIHKFTEDTQLLSERNNIICISDEAHRSQVNLDQKLSWSEKGVKKTFGFAKHLHDSLPNATYVGFTGTPIDATIDVFGKVVDDYTMTESVADEITVRMVYEGRAAKVVLNNEELEKIECFYESAAEEGSNEYQIEQSKTEVASMKSILGDPKRIKTVAEDFVKHYEKRLAEGSTVRGKALFVSSRREIAYDLYQEILKIRPEWGIARLADDGIELSEKEQKELVPIERLKLVMTRNQDDDENLYKLLGTQKDRKELDRLFKQEQSNFKIAIVVDMWLTGFDVPALDTIYIEKPLQKHNLIQTISRVNRTFEGKDKGLIVDYIGIKKHMNLALAMYNNGDERNFEDIEHSIKVLRDHLDLLNRHFHRFDSSKYFKGNNLEQLHTLNMAAEFVQITKEAERRFMDLVKRLKAAYDICVGDERISSKERDHIHFYSAVRSIVFKLTKGDALDTTQLNEKVRVMIQNALQSDGVEEILKIGEEEASEYDLFDEDYLEKINKIKLPNTKIKLLQQLLAKIIGEMKKVNKVKGVDFTRRMQSLVDKYNDRDANDILRSEVYEEMAEALTQMILDVRREFNAGDELGIDFEEKAFYDILLQLCQKYDFTYPNDKMVSLAKSVKIIVDQQARFPDWNKREDIKSALKVELILLLDEFGYPPVERDEVYDEVFEQAENFKKNRV